MNLLVFLRSLAIAVCTGLLLVAGLASAAATDGAPGGAAAVRVAAQDSSHNAAPMWRDVRQGEAGVTTIKGAESGVLVQMEGEAWRQIRNGPVTLIGGALLVVVFAAILLFHAWKGQFRLSAKPSGRRFVRFTLFERVLHNTVAVTFVLLAVGGLMMIFGKHVLVPILGHAVFATLLQIFKPIHNFVGILFVVALLAMIVVWAKDNVWNVIDAEWIRRAGGLLDRSHVPSGRFNFGEKTWFWFGVTFLGLVVSVSGILLDFPAWLELRAQLQTVNLVHGIAALLMILLGLGHFYMGTIGVEGALDTMRSGEVDEVWARDHHAAWFEQVSSRGKAEQ